jgi:hypothetical protein
MRTTFARCFLSRPAQGCQSLFESRAGRHGSVGYNHESAPASKRLTDLSRNGRGIHSADSTDQSGLGMECTLDVFHKSIRIAKKSHGEIPRGSHTKPGFVLYRKRITFRYFVIASDQRERGNPTRSVVARRSPFDAAQAKLRTSRDSFAESTLSEANVLGMTFQVRLPRRFAPRNDASINALAIATAIAAWLRTGQEQRCNIGSDVLSDAPSPRRLQRTFGFGALSSDASSPSSLPCIFFTSSS